MNPRSLDPMKRIDHTILCTSLSEMLREAPRIGYCLRCHTPVDPNCDDWATFAQAGEKLSHEYLVGGILCAACVGAWGVWLLEAAPCSCPGHTKGEG